MSPLGGAGGSERSELRLHADYAIAGQLSLTSTWTLNTQQFHNDLGSPVAVTRPAARLLVLSSLLRTEFIAFFARFIAGG